MSIDEKRINIFPPQSYLISNIDNISLITSFTELQNKLNQNSKNNFLILSELLYKNNNFQINNPILSKDLNNIISNKKESLSTQISRTENSNSNKDINKNKYSKYKY